MSKNEKKKCVRRGEVSNENVENIRGVPALWVKQDINN